MQYLDWVAANSLNADQTRLCWWGTDSPKPGGRGNEAVEMLGQFFADRTLAYGSSRRDLVHLYLVAGAVREQTDRLLIAIVPEAAEKFGRMRLTLSLQTAPHCSAEAVQWSAERAAVRWSPAVIRNGTQLVLSLDRTVAEPLTIFLRWGK